MGIGTNAFKREIGKNLGKSLSNTLLGDSHATPYRRVYSAQPSQPRPTKAQLIYEENIARIEAEKEIQFRVLSEQKKQHKEELELQERLYNDIKQTEHQEYLNSYILELQNDIKNALDLETSQPTISLINELVSVLETKIWHNKLDVGTKTQDKNIKRLENELSNLLLMKYRECLENNTFNLSISKNKYYLDTLNKFERRKNEGLYSVIGANVGLLAMKAFNLVKGLATKEISDGEAIQIEPVYTEFESIESKEEVVESSIFFDLNINNRISLSLSKIWEKYTDLVDKNIISRKPIFSADGVVESFLFVGINPSFDPSDDSVFLKSDDQKSLLYGSFYQRDDAPDYFKKLEEFSESFEKGYTHINLLYARENDRDFLLKTNSDFIREQLELTYDTILNIKPTILFFFGSYCKSLIFGADRWIDPNSKINGHYILKGTNFPVIFSEDIVFMEDADKMKLISMLRSIIK
jgi:hypothetical protein